MCYSSRVAIRADCALQGSAGPSPLRLAKSMPRLTLSLCPGSPGAFARSTAKASPALRSREQDHTASRSPSSRAERLPAEESPPFTANIGRGCRLPVLLLARSTWETTAALLPSLIPAGVRSRRPPSTGLSQSSLSRARNALRRGALREGLMKFEEAGAAALLFRKGVANCRADFFGSALRQGVTGPYGETEHTTDRRSAACGPVCSATVSLSHASEP